MLALHRGGRQLGKRRRDVAVDGAARRARRLRLVCHGEMDLARGRRGQPRWSQRRGYYPASGATGCRLGEELNLRRRGIGDNAIASHKTGPREVALSPAAARDLPDLPRVECSRGSARAGRQ